MRGHDVIVIGTSAGGLKALTALVSQLPGDLPASVLIVQHLAADRPSQLPRILSDVGGLPAEHPVDRAPLEPGRIYVAPPDHHLLVSQSFLRVVRGPRENRFRPSIDALFRSAAVACGPRVVGVVLTGALGDGTIGLQAIRRRGGITVVQDPAEAEYPSMPATALRYAKVHHVLPLADIPALLTRLAGTPVSEVEEHMPAPRDLAIESSIAEQRMNSTELLNAAEEIGARTTYTCPECNGTIWKVGEEEELHYRCHVGHSYGGDVFLGSMTRNLEEALWSAVRIMEEKATFVRDLARRTGNGSGGTAMLDHAAELDREVAQLRGLLIRGAASASMPAEQG
jgi:two-component system chemotaxis response regulator CheB